MAAALFNFAHFAVNHRPRKAQTWGALAFAEWVWCWSGNLKSRCAFLLLAAALFVTAGCSSVDDSASSSTQHSAPVPGEVNPDAPDASQNMRTTPGVNF
ncbi:MAG: hypothetical protein ACR2FX_13325 [Chthoniobacterales bacterium]